MIGRSELVSTFFRALLLWNVMERTKVFRRHHFFSIFFLAFKWIFGSLCQNGEFERGQN